MEELVLAEVEPLDMRHTVSKDLADGGSQSFCDLVPAQVDAAEGGYLQQVDELLLALVADAVVLEDDGADGGEEGDAVDEFAEGCATEALGAEAAEVDLLEGELLSGELEVLLLALLALRALLVREDVTRLGQLQPLNGLRKRHLLPLLLGDALGLRGLRVLHDRLVTQQLP